MFLCRRHRAAPEAGECFGGRVKLMVANAVKCGVVPLTQLRVRRGFASPTYATLSPTGGEGRVRGLLA
jgi:hypothetical protein